MKKKNAKQRYKEIRDGFDTKQHNNPFMELLIKYSGDLMCASPIEIERATIASGTEGEAKRKRRQAIQKYDQEYDKNGVRKKYLWN